MRLNGLLPVLSVSVACVWAQGYVGGDQSNCDAAGGAFQYLGCFSYSDNGPNAGFTWQLSSNPDSVNYYPGYNGSLTPAICQTGCRGHGFKYAGLSDQTNCYCSSDFPNPGAQESTADGIGPYEGNDLGASSDASVCQVSGQGCSGDSTQYCGSSDGMDIYSDPTVSNSSDARQASNFKYLGCFTNAAPGPFYAYLDTSGTADCAAYCGLLGYSYMGRDGIDDDTQGGSNNGFATCGCGSEIRTGGQVDDSHCNFYCNGTTGAS